MAYKYHNNYIYDFTDCKDDTVFIRINIKQFNRAIDMIEGDPGANKNISKSFQEYKQLISKHLTESLDELYMERNNKQQ